MITPTNLNQPKYIHAVFNTKKILLNTLLMKQPEITFSLVKLPQ